MNKAAEKKKIGVLGIIKRLVPVVCCAAPGFMAVDIMVSILHGISWGLQTTAQQVFFDRVTELSLGNTALDQVFLALGFLGCANVGCQALNGVSNFLPTVMNGKIRGKLSFGIHQKIARLSPVMFEDAARLDDINKAEQGKNNAIGFVNIILMILTFYLPYFLYMGGYLFVLKPILVVAILLVFIPTTLTQSLRTRIFANLEDQSAPMRRKCEYFESCITSREYFKETRLLGGFRYFKNLYLDTLDTMQKIKMRSNMKVNWFELSMRMLTVAGYCGILLLLFDALLKQEISVGAFAAVFSSIGSLYNLMEEVICRHIGSMSQNIGTLQNYLNFLELEEESGSVDKAPGWGDVVLQNVSFSYPGASTPAVKNVSLTLHKGETLAVVGENGSGKSTLIRLICGLYQPQSGSVWMNGVDARKLTAKARYQDISAVFQKYQRYQMTLRENITISSPDREWDERTLDEVCKVAGVEQDRVTFPDGYETMLSREFGGVDLSGGQWQRVAIARGFFKKHSMIVLDEPTAAIDPYEETRVYRQFAEISKEKSAIVVTHRLGSVKIADRIAVMKEGRVCQVGTHEELVHIEGEYQRLWESQERWYE